MKTLLWITAYLTFSYLFSLLNVWAWKNKVEKRMDYSNEREKKTCHAEFKGVARFLWPLSSGIMPFPGIEHDQDVTDNLPILDIEIKSYFATMILVGSTVKVMFLCFVFLAMFPFMVFIHCLDRMSRAVTFFWGVLVFLASNLPGARKTLQ